ncbi:hypothetical protein KI387_019804, partial [Taxus chinensis]
TLVVYCLKTREQAVGASVSCQMLIWETVVGGTDNRLCGTSGGQRELYRSGVLVRERVLLRAILRSGVVLKSPEDQNIRSNLT